MSDEWKLARMLDKRSYGNEISSDEAQQANDLGLVVVFGYSDDNMEFSGAIEDKVSCFDGGFAYLSPSGLIENDCSSQYCPHYKRAIESASKIEAIWSNGEFAWVYKTDIPHETFIIWDEDEEYCKGIVFLLSNAINKPTT